jgi:hypothetical protein
MAGPVQVVRGDLLLLAESRCCGTVDGSWNDGERGERRGSGSASPPPTPARSTRLPGMVHATSCSAIRDRRCRMAPRLRGPSLQPLTYPTNCYESRRDRRGWYARELPTTALGPPLPAERGESSSGCAAPPADENRAASSPLPATGGGRSRPRRARVRGSGGRRVFGIYGRLHPGDRRRPLQSTAVAPHPSPSPRSAGRGGPGGVAGRLSRVRLIAVFRSGGEGSASLQGCSGGGVLSCSSWGYVSPGLLRARRALRS